MTEPLRAAAWQSGGSSSLSEDCLMILFFLQLDGLGLDDKFHASFHGIALAGEALISF